MLTSYTPGGVTSDTLIPPPERVDMPDELTPEQLLFYSAGEQPQS